jgi:hypothetical protein
MGEADARSALGGVFSVRRGRKPPAGSRRSPENRSFAAERLEDDLAGEMLVVLHGMGPRDLKVIGALIAKVRQVEADRGEAAAREMIDAITAILLRRGLSAE